MPGGNSSKIQWLARAGYASRGVVYMIIGGFAVAAAFGQESRTPDSKGALLEVYNQPFGRVLLVILAAGLVLYSSWRFIQAICDTENHRAEIWGLGIRSGMFVSGVSYLGLAFSAVVLLIPRAGSSGGDSSPQGTAAFLLDKPYGRWLVIILGLVVVGVGVAQLVSSVRGRFLDRMDASPHAMKWISSISRFGLSARGVVFLISGVFFVIAAVQFDPDEARGLAGALSSLREHPFGRVLFTIVALGLFAFGLYSMLEARYRRIEPPEFLK